MQKVETATCKSKMPVTNQGLRLRQNHTVFLFFFLYLQRRYYVDLHGQATAEQFSSFGSTCSLYAPKGRRRFIPLDYLSDAFIHFLSLVINLFNPQYSPFFAVLLESVMTTMMFNPSPSSTMRKRLFIAKTKMSSKKSKVSPSALENVFIFGLTDREARKVRGARGAK